MCGSKTTGQSNTTTTYTPPPEVLANYKQVTDQAKNVAATPYEGYGGELVSGINGQQNTGIGAVNSASGIQNGYNNASALSSGAATQAIDPNTVTADQIAKYLSPYQSNVIDATTAVLQNQNQQQAAALKGNAISSGAFGGDRAGVAQAALAGQQDLANNQTIANLQNQNYAQALGEANTQQAAGITAQQNTAQNRLAAGQNFTTLGNAAQTEALNEANAQINAGTLQQQTQQAQDTAAYNQFLQKQAYPFETTGWLANIVEGIGSQSGGTSTGQTTTTGSSGGSIIGGLLGLASFLKRGGRVERAAGGGILPRFADGGIAIPYLENQTPPSLGGGSWIAPANLQIGHTMPTGQNTAPATSPSQSDQMAQSAKAVQGFGKSPLGQGIASGISDWFAPAPTALSGAMVPSALGADASFGGDALGGFGALGGFFARGGGIAARRRYDDGGALPIGDFNPDALVEDPLTAAADLGTPEAALAKQYANQMPQPTASAPSPTGFGPIPSWDAPSPAPLRQSAPATDMASVPAGLMGQMQLGDIPDSVSGPKGIAAAPAPDGVDPTLWASGYRPPTHGDDIGAAVNAVSGVNPNARGMRNNNPGNLESNAWTAGLPGYVGSDGRFAQFASPEQGAAALDRNLQSYGEKGISTPLQIASRWAPSSEKGNDPQSYGGTIASALGVGLNDPVNMSDPTTRAKIAQAIVKIENGSGLGAPPTAVAANGIVPSRGALSPNPDMPVAGAAEAQETAPARTGLLGFNLPADMRMGLLAAGLGMMGGTSRSALVNIGQGGMKGLEAYQQNRSLGAELGLKGAQTQQIQTETALKQKQLDLMMKGIEQLNESGNGAAPSAASVPALSTAPAKAASASSAAPGAAAPAVPGALAPAAPSATVDPEWDPTNLERKAKIAAFAGTPRRGGDLSRSGAANPAVWAGPDERRDLGHAARHRCG